MPRLPRPPIPDSLKCQIAARQLHTSGQGAAAVIVTTMFPGVGRRLPILLWLLFGTEPYRLDHNPALALRKKIVRHGEIVGYRPHANDPDCLLYRTKDAHDIKTYVRGDGAQFSDTALMKRERKRLAGKPEKRHSRIPARINPWPSKGSRPIRWWRNRQP